MSISHGESSAVQNFYSRFSCSNEYGILCLRKKDQLLSLKAISMGLGVNLEGNPLPDQDHSIVIYLQFVDRNILQLVSAFGFNSGKIQ
jgi:hypothetical protein